MIIASSLHDLVELYQVNKVVLACGIFDGVHRGHQKILQRLVEAAAENRALPTVLSFSPHPKAVLNHGLPPPLLTDRKLQIELMADCGVEAVVIVDFNPSVAALSAEGFMQRFVFFNDLKVAAICVGAGWRFGAGGHGNTALLTRMGEERGFKVFSVPEFRWYGLPVSSTRIREKIGQGKISTANRMLGRCHAFRGRVVRGRGLGGSQFECPTANLSGSNVLVPPSGVYAGHVVIDTDLPREKRFFRSGAIYVGSAPSMVEKQLSRFFIECHIFDFIENIYDREIEVQFVERVRSDRIFPDKQSLAAQIKKDIRSVRRLMQPPS